MRRVSFCRRRDREARCDAGAAPATVTGEIAAPATGWGFLAGKALPIGDPEPGDLLAARLQPTILGRRSVLPNLAASTPPCALRGRLPRSTLVLGGARSGKSRFSEALIEGTAPAGLYLATASAGDAEMAARIAHHRARRGPRWTTVEEPFDLVARLRREARADRPILIDCLTLWLSNLLLAGRDVDGASADLVSALPELAGPVVLVANEVGLGIVPEGALARAFRDHAGWLNQAVAAVAECVVFIAAGLPLILKDTSEGQR